MKKSLGKVRKLRKIAAIYKTNKLDFYRYFGFFDIFLLRQLIIDDVSIFHFEYTLNRLFNNCIKYIDIRIVLLKI